MEKLSPIKQPGLVEIRLPLQEHYKDGALKKSLFIKRITFAAVSISMTYEL